MVPTGPTSKYAYYFERSRPEFVTRLLERKHRSLLGLARREATVSSMLEIGPGEGFVARAASTTGIPNYIGLEASTTGAERLVTAGFDVRVAVVPPLPDGLPSFDLIYASHVIEHLPGPQAVIDFLADCTRQVRSTGVIALVFPDARVMRSDFWDCDYTHQWPSTPRRVAQVAHDVGLRVLRTYHCCLYFHGMVAHFLRQLVRLYPQRLLSAVDSSRDDFWYRGKLLFAPDVLMLLRATSTPWDGVPTNYGDDVPSQ